MDEQPGNRRRESARARGMKGWFAGLARWLGGERYRLRSSGVGFLLATFFVASVILFVADWAYDAIGHRKTTPVIATIRGVGLCGKYHPGQIRVIAQDDERLTGSACVTANMFLGCRVGDKVRAGRYGLALTVDPAPCPIKLQPALRGDAR
jgi:hypothetical protein